MKNAFALVALVLLMSVVSARAQPHTFRGYMGVEGGTAYSYKLVFDDSSGYIRGYAYTYIEEGKEVKATISGRLDRQKKNLFFQETSIVYNHGFEASTTMCLVKATLSLKKSSDGSDIFSGPITSSDAGNVFCGQGTISFPVNEAVKRLLNQPSAIPAPAPKLKKPVRVVYDTARPPLAVVSQKKEKEAAEQITEGTNKAIVWQSDTLKLAVWDGGREDGDRVTISCNEHILLKDYEIKVQPVSRIMLLPPGTTVITIQAVNEGNEPPNTANLVLTDGLIQHKFVAYNTIGKKAIIRLVKSNR